MTKLQSSFVTAILCYSLLTAVILPKTTAHKKHNIDEFLVEDQRTHLTKNYVMQRNLENDILGDNLGVAYAVESLEPEASPEELPALIMDYANMIRNDIILLDNSVETRTRKRGNIMAKHNNQAISESSCSCEYNKEAIDLGDDTFPRFIETKICNESLCSPCHKSLYNLTVLKRRTKGFEESVTDLPDNLKHHWVAKKEVVTVGCTCVKQYVNRS